jgi:serine/threonine protein kinase/Tfp pilus assembly protein PilF
MIGKTISHYEILEKLGEGGMGVVYKAHDTKLNRSVALKFLPHHLTSDPNTKHRFEQEARTASSLDHSNISVIHEIGETEDGRSYICMGFYDGETLREKIDREALSIEAAVDITLQIAKGLERAHEAGIIHRDIKPANILLTARNEVKIVDFGLAKLMNEAGITEDGRTVGTLAYMSPEQLQGKQVDRRTDLFSLGILMYEMLTGRRPFIEEHHAALMYSIVNTEPAPPSINNPSVPKALEEIVLKLIQKNPDHRFGSATEVIRQLENANQTDQPSAEMESGSFRSFLRQPKTIISILLVVLIISALSVPTTRNSIFEFSGLTPTLDDIHIVVLPFTNVGEDPANRAFNDGLVELLTSSITMLQPQDVSYWVVSASEVRQRNVSSAQDALREFNATLVLYGSTQRLPDRVRLTLNLVDSKTARQISSRVLTVPIESLPNLQDEAVSTLASMLNIEDSFSSTFAAYTGLTGNPKSYELYLEGRGYLQNYQDPENIRRAISLFEEATNLDPGYTLAYAGLGEASWRMYNETRDSDWVNQARDYSRKAMDSGRTHPDVFITDGMIQLGTGDYDAAVNSYRRALQMDPANADAHRGLSAAYAQLGMIDEAEEILKRAIRLRPSNWSGYNQLGSFYINQGRFSESIPAFEKVIELIPNSSMGYSNLGVAYYYLDDHQKTIELFNKAIEIEPIHFVYTNLGTLYFYQSDFEQSARMYENALNMSDQDHQTWGNLASASKWAGRDSNSVNEFYRNALIRAQEEKSVNPHDALLLVTIAGYQAALGHFDDAHRNLENALLIAPENFSVTGYAGRVFENLGERDRALELIKDALEKGYTWSEIESDPHLSDFRKDPDFIRFRSTHFQNNTE